MGAFATGVLLRLLVASARTHRLLSLAILSGFEANVVARATAKRVDRRPAGALADVDGAEEAAGGSSNAAPAASVASAECSAPAESGLELLRRSNARVPGLAPHCCFILESIQARLMLVDMRRCEWRCGESCSGASATSFDFDSDSDSGSGEHVDVEACALEAHARPLRSSGPSRNSARRSNRADREVTAGSTASADSLMEDSWASSAARGPTPSSAPAPPISIGSERRRAVRASRASVSIEDEDVLDSAGTRNSFEFGVGEEPGARGVRMELDSTHVEDEEIGRASCRERVLAGV